MLAAKFGDDPLLYSIKIKENQLKFKKTITIKFN